MQSRLRELLHRKVRASKLAIKSANGSVNISQRRFENLCSMTSGCETTSAGRCSTASSIDCSDHPFLQLARPDNAQLPEIGQVTVGPVVGTYQPLKIISPQLREGETGGRGRFRWGLARRS